MQGSARARGGKDQVLSKNHPSEKLRDEADSASLSEEKEGRWWNGERARAVGENRCVFPRRDTSHEYGKGSNLILEK